MSPDTTPLLSLLGGALIGASASMMLLLEGRITGISGIVGGLLSPKAGDIGWRLSFIAGLATAGLFASLFAPDMLAVEIVRPSWAILLAGLLVGAGTRLGNGCTSGHGVCGLSRQSPRSLASVLAFMTTGVVSAIVFNRLAGAP